MPLLRECRDDISLLIQHYLQFYALQYGKPQISIDEACLARLKETPWKGNIRELQNAAAHAFAGDGQGSLRIAASADDGMVEMLVVDNGKGMAADTLERIFEPFFTTRMGQGGSGLGLTICRNIATGVLGGSLQATSQLGAGTRFVLRFPFRAPRQGQSPNPLRDLAF